MAPRYITRSTLLTIKQTLTSVAVSRHSLRHRPLIAAASAFNFARDEGNVFSARSFATSQTTSSLNDPDPNWNNRPPKETIYLDGCDFEHWVVIMKQPEGDPSRDEIIDSYIKTFAMVVGSEEEARMKIYSVSTRHYFAFGALVSEELAYKLKELPRVQWVLPDSYLDVKNKDYGGEPFINGQAVPYDPKYHEWLTVTYRGSENQELGMGEGAEFGCEEERNENGVFGEEDPEIRREKKIFQWNFIYSKIKNMFSLLIFRERPKN